MTLKGLLNFNRILGLENNKNCASELHRRSMQEIELTVEKIHEMNKILVKKSTAYKVYIATGRKAV